MTLSGKYGINKTVLEVQLFTASKIRKIRKQQQFTQKELSKKSGVSYASVRLFETTGKISLESFFKICNALNRLHEMENILVPDSLQEKDKLFDS